MHGVEVDASNLEHLPVFTKNFLGLHARVRDTPQKGEESSMQGQGKARQGQGKLNARARDPPCEGEGRPT